MKWPGQWTGPGDRTQPGVANLRSQRRGAVINFAAEDGRTQMVGLDPVIALQLLQMLIAAVEQCNLLGDDGTFNTQETIQ